MLRLRRDQKGLIFELTPPFDGEFFNYLESTINDFIIIGARTFYFDFLNTTELDGKVAGRLDALAELFQRKRCSVYWINGKDPLLAQLPNIRMYHENLSQLRNRISVFNLTVKKLPSMKMAILTLNGEFRDASNLEKFKTMALELLVDSSVLGLDFRRLNHATTLAIGAVAYLKIYCDSLRKSLFLWRPVERVQETMRMSGISHIVPMFEKLNEARSLFISQPS